MANWSVPAGIHALEGGVLVAVMAFTDRSSILRPALLPIMLYLSTCTLADNKASMPTKLLAGCISSNGVGLLLQYIDFALISRWSYRAQGPTSGAGGQKDLCVEKKSEDWWALLKSNPTKALTSAVQESRRRVVWGLRQAVNYRATASPWQVKNTPPFDRSDPTRMPSKTYFLLTNTAMFIACTLFVDLMSVRKKDNATQAVSFAASQVPFFGRLSELTGKDVAKRVVISFVGWFATYVVLQGGYALLAVLSILLGLTGVEKWPPQFGAWKDCSGLRQFWGATWHQCFRQRFGSPSHFLSYTVLKLKKGGLTGRYLTLLGTFVLSGLMHVAEEYGTGVPLRESGSMRFFVMQVFGIMFEDAVKATFKRYFGEEERWWTRAIGHVWFVVWMAWTTPSWFYPKFRQPQTDDGLLPFTVLRPLLRKAD